jgi:hypothetical protein
LTSSSLGGLLPNLVTERLSCFPYKSASIAGDAQILFSHGTVVKPLLFCLPALVSMNLANVEEVELGQNTEQLLGAVILGMNGNEGVDNIPVELEVMTEARL